MSRPNVCVIGGCGRSGTTLLLAMMSAHPELHTINKETNAYANNKPPYGLKPHQFRLGKIEGESKKAKKANKILVEKTPRNVHSFQSILDRYGERVKIIHLVRDGRDVCTSKFPKQNTYYVSPERWVKDTRAGLKVVDDPRVMTVTYEALIKNEEDVLSAICDHLSISKHPKFFDWTHNARLKKSHAWNDGGKLQKTYKKKIGRWLDHTDRVNELYKNKEFNSLLIELGYDGADRQGE